jgi:hypothetical protein
MLTILKILSFTGLGFTIFPSVLVLAGAIDMEMNKNLMLIGTVLWFGTAVFWMNRKKKIP